jgi:membrane protease YdiL (CAAX protease family)
LILFLIFAAFAVFIADFFALSLYSVLQPWAGWKTPLQSLRSDPLFLLALQALFYVLIYGYIYGLIVLHYRLPFWAAIRWGRSGFRGAGVFIIAGFVLAFAVQLVPAILPDKQNFPLLQLFNSPAADYAMAIFAVFLAPFMEELVFRGFFFEIFETRMGLKVAIFMTALMFAALHISEYWGAWNHVLMIFVAGLAFSLTRAATGSIVPCVLMHSVYNATLMVLLFFQTQHFHQFQAMLRGLK